MEGSYGITGHFPALDEDLRSVTNATRDGGPEPWNQSLPSPNIGEHIIATAADHLMSDPVNAAETSSYHAMFSGAKKVLSRHHLPMMMRLAIFSLVARRVSSTQSMIERWHSLKAEAVAPGWKIPTFTNTHQEWAGLKIRYCTENEWFRRWIG